MWVAVGPDDVNKRYVQIGDWFSNWPGEIHSPNPSWSLNGSVVDEWHSNVVVIRECGGSNSLGSADTDDKWYNY